LFLHALLCAPLFAQLPAHQCITTGTVTRTFVEATIVVLQEPDRIHTFSTVLKQWFTLPVSGGAVFYGYDDHVIIVDNGQAHGFATRHGVFQSVPLANAPVVTGAPAPTWLSVLTDSTTTHLFSAFTGTWSSVTFGTTPTTSVSKLTALVSDGAQTFGYSAAFGTLVPLPVSGVTTVLAMGYGGCAESPGQISFFSAPRNSWRTTASSPTATLSAPPLRAATFLLRDGTNYTFWSALTDSLASLSTSGAETVRYADLATVVIDGTQAWGYSAATGNLHLSTTTAPTLLASSSYWALLADGPDVLAFSGMRGTWSTLPNGAASTLTTNALSASAVLVDGSGVAHCYSSVTGQWHHSVAMSAPVVHSTYAGAVIRDPALGCFGFSAMHGTFTALPGVTPTRIVQFGGNFVCETANQLHVFNPQLPAWRSQAIAGPTGVLRAHHAAVVADDGASIYFYGTYDDRWTRLFVSGLPSDLQPSDECGFFTLGNSACAFGASGQLSNEAIFPEWWRVLSRGSKSTWHIAGEPGALPLLALSTASGNTVVPGIGRLLIDPNAAVTLFVPPIPLVGTTKYEWQLPNVAAAQGLTLHAQAAILKAQGIYLTNVYRSTIF
jgi:hypothetical protein